VTTFKRLWQHLKNIIERRHSLTIGFVGGCVLKVKVTREEVDAILTSYFNKARSPGGTTRQILTRSGNLIVPWDTVIFLHAGWDWRSK
jgi:hypothetical protein